MEEGFSFIKVLVLFVGRIIMFLSRVGERIFMVFIMRVALCFVSGERFRIVVMIRSLLVRIYRALVGFFLD